MVLNNDLLYLLRGCSISIFKFKIQNFAVYFAVNLICRKLRINRFIFSKCFRNSFSNHT